MVYKVRADNIAKDIDNEVQKSILDFLQTYDFPLFFMQVDLFSNVLLFG